MIAEQEAELLLVGLPLMPDGTRGDQANATMAFVGRLRPQTDVPIEFEDERFTSAVAQAKGGEAGLDARAAAESVYKADVRRAGNRAADKARAASDQDTSIPAARRDAAARDAAAAARAKVHADAAAARVAADAAAKVAAEEAARDKARAAATAACAAYARQL